MTTDHGAPYRIIHSDVLDERHAIPTNDGFSHEFLGKSCVCGVRETEPGNFIHTRLGREEE